MSKGNTITNLNSTNSDVMLVGANTNSEFAQFAFELNNRLRFFNE